MTATAAGALCQVALPPATEDTIREAWRVMGAAGDAPVVVAITRRTDELDAFLAQADRLYLATPTDDAYTHLALESLVTPADRRPFAPTHRHPRPPRGSPRPHGTAPTRPRRAPA